VAVQVSTSAGQEDAETPWQLLAAHSFTLGFKMATSMYVLYRTGLGDSHRRQTVESLEGGGWGKLRDGGRRDWRKQWLQERGGMTVT
jgi:hypothetical protein